MKHILTLLAAALLIALASCGSSTTDSALPDNSAALINTHIVTPDILTPDDSSRDTSATFKKFYTDTVNDQSTGRWTTANDSGFKQWTLTNSTYYSSPRAWIMGGNLYNYENDTLQTNSFSIPDQTNMLALTFYARWQITDPGDKCVLSCFPGFGSPTQLGTFEGGSNPSYPGWDKYYFLLPSNSTGFAQNYNISYKVTTDSSINSWGFGVDSVTVYQTQLNPPTGVTASDGTQSLSVHVAWNHNNAGNLVPAGYNIYMSATPGGPYNLIDAIAYPATSKDINTGNQTTYYFVVKSFLSSIPESVDSNEDSGFGGA